MRCQKLWQPEFSCARHLLTEETPDSWTQRNADGYLSTGSTDRHRASVTCTSRAASGRFVLWNSVVLAADAVAEHAERDPWSGYSAGMQEFPLYSKAHTNYNLRN